MAYALAATAPRLLSLLLLPIYTRHLTPAEYGQVAIVATVGLGVQALVSFGLETAVFREFVRSAESPDALRRITNTFGLFAIVAPTGSSLLLGTVLAATIADPLGVPAFSIALASLAAGLQSAALIFPLARMRADERLAAYVRTTVAAAGFGAALTVAGVVWLDLGVAAWFGASLLAALGLVLLGLRELHHRWSHELDRPVLVAALAFGLPLLPHFLAHWGLNVSDRLVLAAFVGQDQVGIYGLAQQFALPASIVVLAISQALMPKYAASSRPGKDVGLARVLTNQALVVAFVCLAVALLAPPAILVMAPAEYASAADIVAWVVLGYLFFGLYLGPMNVVSLSIGKTRWIWVMTAVAALANVALNLALVPTYGVAAAAVNTAIGYALLLALVHMYLAVVCRRPTTYEARPLVLGGTAMAGVYIGTIALLPEAGALITLAERLLIVGIVGSVGIGLFIPRRSDT